MRDVLIKNEYKEMLLKICRDFSIDLIFLFGSQKEKGLSILKGEEVQITDPLADMDIGAQYLEKGHFLKGLTRYLA